MSSTFSQEKQENSLVPTIFSDCPKEQSDSSSHTYLNSNVMGRSAHSVLLLTFKSKAADKDTRKEKSQSLNIVQFYQWQIEKYELRRASPVLSAFLIGVKY